MRPEMPFLAAGSVAIIGGAISQGGWPKEWPTVVVGTVVLVVVSSATADTAVAPLIRAIGLLILLSASIAAVRTAQKRKKK